MRERTKPYSRIAAAASALAVLSLLAAVASGLGHRTAFWDLATGFLMLRWAVIGALGSVLLALGGMYVTRPGASRRGFGSSIAALLLGVLVAVPPLGWLWIARQAPVIHDITTDTENPPSFVAVLPLRAEAPNAAEYGGPEVAALQRAAYPDIVPLITRVSSERAFEAALATARGRGWAVVAADPSDGLIEATDTTFWFGFVDDVVIRITPRGEEGTRVDVRSVSRVGRGDVGTNTRRIRGFLRDLRARIGERDK